MILRTKGKAPKATQLREYILKVMRSFPIAHLMPTDNFIDVERYPYIINKLASGRYCIKPNITQQPFLFCGTTIEDKDNIQYILRSDLAKELVNNINARLIRNIQREDFVRMLNSYPLYALLSNGIEFNNNEFFRIENPYGLASLYDYPTTLIKMTSDIDFALMQATNDYNTEDKDFHITNKRYGVLFVFELRVPFGYIKGLSNLGKLPFFRAVNSKFFLYNLPDYLCFENLPNVKAFIFEQDRNESQQYLDYYREKNIYVSPDEDFILKKCISYEDNKVSEYAFRQNLLKNPKDNEEMNRRLMSDKGYEIDRNYNFCFTYEELKENETKIRDLWCMFTSEIFASNDKERKILDILRRLPEEEKYRKYFDINLFFNV